jgi:hypothetical protein
MASQYGVDFGACAWIDGIELGHDLASAHDRETLASMLYGIEDVREVPRCVGRAHLRHGIRLSDTDARNALQVRHPAGRTSTQ